MNREVLTGPERNLIVELCRYHAQTLLASRNGFDIDGLLQKVDLPADGVVQADTVLLDRALSSHEYAASALLDCGFAVVPRFPFNACKLLMSSNEFEISDDFEFEHSYYSHLSCSLSAVFRVYWQNGRLGHPSTMKRVFECLESAELIEVRYGFKEWTEKAIDLTHSRRRFGNPQKRAFEDNFLWVIDTFDWYLEEASEQWSRAA